VAVKEIGELEGSSKLGQGDILTLQVAVLVLLEIKTGLLQSSGDMAASVGRIDLCAFTMQVAPTQMQRLLGTDSTRL
jgi:hypothetical protein